MRMVSPVFRLRVSISIVLLLFLVKRARSLREVGQNGCEQKHIIFNALLAPVGVMTECDLGIHKQTI